MGQTKCAALTNIILSSNKLVTIVQSSVTNQPRRFHRVAGTRLPPEQSASDELVWIRPGASTMGSPTNELNLSSRESPKMQGTVTRRFWIGTYEVPQFY